MNKRSGHSRTVDTSHPYVFEKNVTVPLRNGSFIRCNIYHPKTTDENAKFPVIATYGPYGKDVSYASFNPGSFADVDPAHQTDHSAWETPTPLYWTAQGYVVIRADEIGTGQSPGFLDALSTRTVDSFCDLIEWASEQSWCTGKIGLLGISYFAATQWQVAARNPKGLAAIVPWEGFSDYYRDACRHGGILSNAGVQWIWNRQIGSNQYGLPGRAARNWGDDTVDGDLTEEQLQANRTTIVESARANRFRDSSRFASVNFNMEDIKVPLLSVANWGGILLHLRGNVYGYTHASSEFKYLRFIVGRHDLPFYYPEEVEVQRSFLDAFLKGDDRVGWSIQGKIPPIDLILRKGNVGYNDPSSEKKFHRRQENEWPIARTKYTKLFLDSDGKLLWNKHEVSPHPRKMVYRALGTVESLALVSFTTAPFHSETEITGHIVVRLCVSMSPDAYGTIPSDIDLFVSVRHLSRAGSEIFYTGTTGEPAPVTKGFLRVSLRRTDPQHSRHRAWLPHRNYLSTDVLPVLPNEVYEVDVEIWPTNVVIEEGERLVLEVGSGDTTGTGIFKHDDPDDRSEEIFKGTNFLHFGLQYSNYISLPVIPPL